MESLFFLVPIALVFVALALRALFWAINSGQYDNLDTEAHRILFDEDEKSSSGTIKNKLENETESPVELTQKKSRIDAAHKPDSTPKPDATHKEQGNE